MIYRTFSYDHGIIYLKDSDGFLMNDLELIEAPERLLNKGVFPEKLLLDL